MSTVLRLFKIAIVILLAGFPSLNASKPKAYHTKFVIGFSQCVGSDLWRKTMFQEMKMELSLHPGSKLIYSDAEGDNAKQITQIAEFIKMGVDLLIISPNEAKPLANIVDRANLDGIPVIVLDRKTTSNNYTAFVGANNFQIGMMAAQYLGTTLKGKGNILEITGLAGSSPAIERDKGFKAGLKNYHGFNLVGEISGDWLKDTAERRIMSNNINLNNVDAVFAHNDVMASAVRDVILRYHTRHKIKIIGVDALPGPGGGLQMVADKSIYASLLYPTGGKEAIITALRILNNEIFNKENILETVVIDSSNVQLMKMQWTRISSQQRDIEKQQSLIGEQQEIYRSQQVILNIVVISLVLAIFFGGLAFFSLVENMKINRSLESKNNEINSQRNQLIEMSGKASAATEAKLNFFTNISHEFRTPLTLMLSPVEDLLSSKKSNPTELNNLKLVRKNIFILLKLVNQLIEYRKIEYDNQPLKASPNNIVEFINEILENFRHLAAKRNITQKFTYDEQICELWFDINLLDKVFFNLISNSFKFVGDNGNIVVKLYKHDGELYIEVQDDGIGMTEEQMVHIFDHFYQADNGLNNGSGLGLAISKEIIQLHYGRISVRSEKWRGTTFTIILPLGSAHLKEQERTVQQFDKCLISSQSQNFVYELETHLSVPKYPTFDVPKEYSILIIEDNIELLDYLTIKFEEEFEVFTAANGKIALSEAFERVPDLIISDVLLPEISGKELTIRLKSDMRTSHIPIILLTAQSSIDNQIQGMQSMADAYITKPFNYDYLYATARNLIYNRAILKEHFSSDISTLDRLPISKSLDKKFLNNLAGIVEQNLGKENLNVEFICKALGISRIQLYRKVKALLGYSISEYILNRRLKKAKYLLINESKSIAEITYMVGFTTSSYFATVFKAKYGCTPSEFKKETMNKRPGS